MLIVNADDLGYNAPTNEAILACFEKRLCSSATLMANMEGFEEACELAHAHGLVDHVGLHLNLSEGEPLTDEIRRCPRFCDPDGRFRLLRQERVFWLQAAEQAALAHEIRAQIQRVQRSYFKITHLDSHKHLHEEWAIARTVLPLLKEAGIPYLRLARNLGFQSSVTKRGYRMMLNGWIRMHQMARTQYFGSIKDYVYERERTPENLYRRDGEIMIHPIRDALGNLVDLKYKCSLDCVAKEFRYHDFAVSYSGHHFSPGIGSRMSWAR